MREATVQVRKRGVLTLPAEMRRKYGIEEKPPEVKPKTLEDIRKEDEAMAQAIEQVCATQ